ncbi:MMPL family transporter [Nocardia pseudobrasiliensis]|nr:MMPL family transporter [Nocardia pseudobrasiliensis]
MRRPIVYGLAGTAVLVIAALPLFGIRYGLNMATTQMRDTPSGTANSILARDFSPGLLSPIQIIATGPSNTSLGPESRSATTDFGRFLTSDQRISTVVPLTSDGRALWLAIPANPVDSTAAADLVRDIRSRAADSPNAVLFGLSMDYEIFLLGRVKEEWDRDPVNESAVAAGVEHTARPITAAVAIMVVIFASLLTASVIELKQAGFALAIAIAIDTALARLLLIPAFMKPMGRWNWWPGSRIR